MLSITAPRIRHAAVWGTTFLAFPIAGLAATALVGPVTSTPSALIGGAVVGGAIGLAQSVASRGRLSRSTYPIASAIGAAVGLAAGATAVGFSTSISALAIMGAITGLAVGVAQAATLPRRSHRLTWALATSAIWALGWTVTTAIGIDVENHYATFGASGAIVATAITGALLLIAVPSPDRTVRRNGVSA